MNLKADKYAKLLWNYHLLNQKLQKSDAIFVLGSKDIRVAEYATNLFFKGWAPLLVFSGGYGKFTRDTFLKPEAEVFADIAIQKGVDKKKILIENESTNTGENIQFTYNLLQKKRIKVKQLILAQKPYMERRTWAAFKKQWPEKDTKIVVASPKITFEEYAKDKKSRERFYSAIVGDLHRIKIYPEKGYQIPQEIPQKVEDAYQRLIDLGYDSHLPE